jgi:hypothetical protein
MNCRNHEGVPAEDRCAGCAEGFCSHCLVQVAGRKYCSACKVMAVQGPPQLTDGNMACEEAQQALNYAIIGIFCFGIVFGPMAISKAVAARRLIREDPRLTGEAKANVALILGIMVLLLWLIGVAGKAKARASHF